MSHKPLGAFAASNGPRDARVVLVGEAWGENEELLRVPFVGWSGYELSKILHEAGLVAEPPLEPRAYSNMMLAEWWKRQELLVTNVFAFQARKQQARLDLRETRRGRGGLHPEPARKGRLRQAGVPRRARPPSGGAPIRAAELHRRARRYCHLGAHGPARRSPPSGASRRVPARSAPSSRSFRHTTRRGFSGIGPGAQSRSPT